MRDPDLVVRAQQAATALESAWRRWREMHGLAADPAPPPVSSYVGYSLEAPWGQARIVLGICAEEAEQLATLLEGHDCVGPVHASVTAKPVSRGQGSGLADTPIQPGAAGFLRVPAPAPASAGQQPLSLESAFSRPDQAHPELPSEPRRRASTASSELTKPFAGNSASSETPIALAASRAVEASMASRKQAMNGSHAAVPEPPTDASAAATSATSSYDYPLDTNDAPGAAVGPAGGFGSVSGLRSGPGSVSGLGSGLDPASGLGSGPGSASGPGGSPGSISGAGAGADGDHGSVSGLGSGLGSVSGLVYGPGSGQPQAVAGSARDLPGHLQWPASGESPEQADAVAVTAVGGMPAIPAIQPFPWASLAQFADRERADDREAGPGSPGIVAFRPRIEAGPALSTLQRPAQGTDGDHALAGDREQASEHGHAGGSGWPQGSRDRVSSAAANADAATWAASELPGQAAVTDTAV
jgi:hypothetical protein